MDFKLKQKPQTANPAATKTPPYVIPEAEAPTISRAKLEIDIIRDYANRGKVKQAVARIQRLPPEQRDLVVGLLSVLPQTWATLKPALIEAKVHSPSIDLCLAGVPMFDPLRPQQSVNRQLTQVVAFQNRPLGDKMRDAIAVSPLGEDLKKELLSLFSATTLAAAAVVFGAMQFIPAGWAVDAGVLVVSGLVFGKAAWDIGAHLGRFTKMCELAGTEQQLQQAGQEFAQAVAIMGVNALGALIGRAGAVKAKAKLAPKPMTLQDLAKGGWVGFEATAADRAAFRARYSADAWAVKVARVKKGLAGHPEYDNVPTEELVALHEYTIISYESINTALRTGDAETLRAFDVEIRCIVSALRRFPAFNGEVSRGVMLEAADLMPYRVGMVVTERQFLSTSRGNPFGGNAMFIIQSLDGRMIHTVSAAPKEMEVLFKPGTQFLVRRIDYDHWGFPTIRMSEVKK